jgi:tetratricopeptide (TPR) repeat protein
LSKAERKPMFEAKTLQNLGDCLLETEKPAEARTVFQQALQLKETWFDEDSVTTAKAMLGLAKADLALCNQGHATLRDEGRSYAERAEALFEQFGRIEELEECREKLRQFEACGTTGQ